MDGHIKYIKLWVFSPIQFINSFS